MHAVLFCCTGVDGGLAALARAAGLRCCCAAAGRCCSSASWDGGLAVLARAAGAGLGWIGASAGGFEGTLMGALPVATVGGGDGIELGAADAKAAEVRADGGATETASSEKKPRPEGSGARSTACEDIADERGGRPTSVVDGPDDRGAILGLPTVFSLRPANNCASVRVSSDDWQHLTTVLD